MKVLAINSSPNMEKGITALILNPFLEGMKKAGAQVDLLYTKSMKINPCQADHACGFATLGQCVQNDDMQLIHSKIVDANLVVLASPLYVDGFNGAMKDVIDRLLAMVDLSIEILDGHTHHPLNERFASVKRQMVLVSSCFQWELDNFDLTVAHAKAICWALSAEYAGALLRPESAAFQAMLGAGAPVKDIVEAAEQAGRQLVRDGKMSEQTLGAVSREILPRETYVENMNQFIKQTIAATAKK